MSGQDAEAAQLTAFYDSIFVENCCGFASLSLLIFEYIITFDREVAHFWGRKTTGATVLFLCNRYIPLLVNVVSTIGMAPLSSEGCDVMVHLSPFLIILQYLPWAAFAALRVFALSQRHWPVTTIVLLLSLVPVAINLYLYSTFTSLNDPVFGCEAVRDVSASLLKK
ncbi:hypothetical protein OH77DRAFT_1524201 [Trametes cingulata]|nr:hypothetical protein OH77DRAFT_1524201 [Trametes cingulata]